MRVFASALGALLLVASAPPPAGAQTQPKQPKAYVKKEAPPQATAEPRGDGYTERLADKLPYGSQAWWDQMLREGRLGTEHP